MAKLAIIVLGLIVVQACQALQCKKCKDVKCDSLENQTCPVDAGSKQAACLTYIYKDANNEQVTKKECVNFDSGTKYKCANDQVEEISCDTCDKDFCNSGWRNDINHALFSISFLVPLILLKMI